MAAGRSAIIAHEISMICRSDACQILLGRRSSHSPTNSIPTRTTIPLPEFRLKRRHMAGRLCSYPLGDSPDRCRRWNHHRRRSPPRRFGTRPQSIPFGWVHCLIPPNCSASQLRAKFQWRVTVRDEQFMRAAISSLPSPSKTRNSTTRRSCGSRAANCSSALSIC